MSDWQLKLRVGDLWEAHGRGDISLQEMAGGIAKRLRRKVEYLDKVIEGKALKMEGLERQHVDEIEQITTEMETLRDDPGADTEWFDYLWEQVYDWADTPLNNKWPPKKLCWVEIWI